MAGKKAAMYEEDSPRRIDRSGFDTWDTFTSMAKAGVSLPLLFTPQLVGLGAELTRIVTGQSDLKPPKDDHRFEDPTWHENPIYKASMQTYLAWCNHLTGAMNNSNLDTKSKTQAKVAIKLLTDSLSPTHPTNNLSQVKRAVRARGASLVHGLNRMTSDILQQNDASDSAPSSSLKLGKDIAASPGAVVYQADQLELIQYQPTTSNVFSEPLLIIPSPINKFYISDLYRHNSLTHYLLDAGFQVFTVSWRNPSEEHRDWNLDTYLQSLLDVTEVVKAISGSPKLNLFGHSAGGIFSAILISILQQRGGVIPHTASFAMTNFYTHTESQVGAMINSQMIQAAKTLLQLRGILDGKELARMFAWLRPNNLLWNAWVCNYFASEDQPTADVRFWNTDIPKISNALFSDFLDFYADNRLLEPGQFTLCDTPIDLSLVSCNKYIIAGSSDHITPWECCYQSSLNLGKNREFVLVNRGHTRSIVCPEGSKAARFYTNSHPDESHDDWLSNATQHQGSWWSNWTQWLEKHAEKRREAPRTLGNDKFPAIDKAPGSYVTE